MKRWYLVSLLLMLATGAYLLAGDHDRTTSPRHEAEIHHSDHWHVAMTDMLHHATVHLACATPHPHSFGGARDWADGWELHWMDFHSEGHTIRVYHATHEHHPRVRFVAIADHEHGHSGAWRSVH